MEEHLRMAVCFWHTFCWEGNDNFGAGVFNREWLKEKKTNETRQTTRSCCF